MEPINRWILSCQNRYMISGSGFWKSCCLGGPVGPQLDADYAFTVCDMGDGTFVLQIPGGGGVPDIYPTATNAFLTDDQVITASNVWISQVTDQAKFKAVPIGDGHVALYFPVFGRYLMVNPADDTELQVRGQLGQAARFTATGLDHDSIFDLLQVGKSAQGMVFGPISLAGRDLSGTNLSQCDLRKVTSLAGCKLNGAVLDQHPVRRTAPRRPADVGGRLPERGFHRLRLHLLHARHPPAGSGSGQPDRRAGARIGGGCEPGGRGAGRGQPHRCRPVRTGHRPDRR